MRVASSTADDRHCPESPAMHSPRITRQRPIRIVVVSTPGGSVDTMARAVGPKLAESWGQQVIVDNRPGAGGAIAAELVAKVAGPTATR